MRQSTDSLFRGLFLIILGLVFFANIYGFLPWNFWINLADLWPLILIFAGIALFFNKRIPFSAVMVVFLLAFVGYSFFANNPAGDNRDPSVGGSGQVMELSAPLEANVEKARVTLNLGGVDMDIRGLVGNSNPNEVVTGTYQWNGRANFGEPEFIHRTNGDTTRIIFTTQKRASSGENQLKLNLSDRVEYSKVQVNAGSVNGIMDFSRLKIEDLDINTGASDIELRFGDTGGRTKVDLSTGATKLKLVVPEEVGLKIDISGLASETNFARDGLILSSKDWVSPNYEEAKTKLELDISMAAGKINLERTGAMMDSNEKTESVQTKTW